MTKILDQLSRQRPLINTILYITFTFNIIEHGQRSVVFFAIL